YVRTARSFIKIAREHYAVTVKTNLPSLFAKGFLLNFVNFGVLAGWIGTIIFANALTSSKQGVILFLATVIGVFFTTDLVKISLAKNLKSKMTPRVIYNTKKFVSITIIVFGVLLLIQGVLPEEMQQNLPSLPNTIEQKK
ncbi:MAG: LysE family translocator, partial [Flavobacteriaceae bacterium]